MREKYEERPAGQYQSVTANQAEADEEIADLCTDLCNEDDFWLAFPPVDECEGLPEEGDFWLEPD